MFTDPVLSGNKQITFLGRFYKFSIEQGLASSGFCSGFLRPPRFTCSVWRTLPTANLQFRGVRVGLAPARISLPGLTHPVE
jgi:hypothetical protein